MVDIDDSHTYDLGCFFSIKLLKRMVIGTSSMTFIICHYIIVSNYLGVLPETLFETMALVGMACWARVSLAQWAGTVSSI